MTASDHHTKELKRLVKTLGGRHKAPECNPAGTTCPGYADPVLHELVFSTLVWEAGVSRATAAIEKLKGGIVDYNELRICFVEEATELIGKRYPRVEERCERLRAMLNNVYTNENALSLRHLLDASKREARAYLDALQGVPHFVAARVTAVALGGHAFPFDDRLAGSLVKHGALEPGTVPEAASGKAERVFRAGESLPAYTLIELWSDETRRHGAGPAPAGRPGKTASRTRAGKAAS